MPPLNCVTKKIGKKKDIKFPIVIITILEAKQKLLSPLILHPKKGVMINLSICFASETGQISFQISML